MSSNSKTGATASSSGATTTASAGGTATANAGESKAAAGAATGGGKNVAPAKTAAVANTGGSKAVAGAAAGGGKTPAKNGTGAAASASAGGTKAAASTTTKTPAPTKATTVTKPATTTATKTPVPAKTTTVVKPATTTATKTPTPAKATTVTKPATTTATKTPAPAKATAVTKPATYTKPAATGVTKPAVGTKPAEGTKPPAVAAKPAGTPANTAKPTGTPPGTAPTTTTTAYSQPEILRFLFERPSEPIILPKGSDAKAVFDVPIVFLKERYQPICEDVKKRFDTSDRNIIPVKNITVPDLTIPLKLGIKDNFTLFLPEHVKMAEKLIAIFMDQRTVDDLISVAVYAHERINPYLFNYALSVALLHRTDTKNVLLPNFLQSFPGKFIDSNAFSAIRQETAVVPKAIREPIEIPQEFTANAREPEQKLAYFREDIGINTHHWHWHLVYPTGAENRAIVDKDRRGELFYYMHQQVLARFNAERFSNDLPRVKSFDNLRQSVPEGYFPKLEVAVASRAWPPRFRNTPLSDIDRPLDEFTLKIEEIELWAKNIKEVIEKGVAKSRDGKDIILTEQTGIDILGNMVEASMLTPGNYGSLHNLGHMLFALCHDPDGRFLESFAVMGDTATAMRDPVFYRWHTYINDIFVSHKNKQPQYTVAQLEFKDVSVTCVKVTIDKKPINQLITHWQKSDVDLSRGMDFTPRSPVLVRFTHLQNEEFSFVINANNASNKQLFGTARIFMAPRCKENGVVMQFNEQRHLMIEMDRFKVTLKPGANVIKRSSLDSSVTIPYERTFRDHDTNRPAEDSPSLYAFNFCGCGWPQHMFVPKGTTKGMVFDLFVMISNYEDDKVVQDISGACNDAESFCGIQDKKYPDKRTMGYPFDRLGRDGCSTLAQFLTPNMKVQEITVKFEDRTVIKTLEPTKEISVVPASKP